MPVWLGSVGSIILVDLVLSGDNALVIGAAASRMPRRQRLLAISLGGGGAVLLRILFAVLATLLLQLPYLEAFGAVILLIIAIRLLMDRHKDESGAANKPSEPVIHGFLGSLLTIMAADLTMSLDNILAVGALASGDLLVLVAGLLVSILFLLIGSALVAELITHLPWLLDFASLILAWTASNMILEDKRLGKFLERLPWSTIAIYTLSIAIVLIADVYLWLHARSKQNRKLYM